MLVLTVLFLVVVISLSLLFFYIVFESSFRCLDTFKYLFISMKIKLYANIERKFSHFSLFPPNPKILVNKQVNDKHNLLFGPPEGIASNL